MLLDWNEIIALKEFMAEHKAGYVHVHDTCGGQYFTLDAVDDYTENLIKKYFAEKNIETIFTNDRLCFTIEVM